MILNPKWYGCLASLCGFISSVFITNYAFYYPAGWFFDSVFALGVTSVFCLPILSAVLAIDPVNKGHSLFIEEEKKTLIHNATADISSYVEEALAFIDRHMDNLPDLQLFIAENETILNNSEVSAVEAKQYITDLQGDNEIVKASLGKAVRHLHAILEGTKK